MSRTTARWLLTLVGALGLAGAALGLIGRAPAVVVLGLVVAVFADVLWWMSRRSGGRIR